MDSLALQIGGLALGTLATSTLAYYKLVLPRPLKDYKETATNKQIPIEKYSPSIPFGDLMNIIKDPWGFVESWYTENSMKLYWNLSDPMINIADAEIAKQILSAKDSNYRRDFTSLYLLNRLEGLGIITSDGANWQRQHRIIARAFGPKLIRALVHDMHDIAMESLTEQIDRSIARKESLDVMPLFQRLTMDIVIRTSLGSKSANVDFITDKIFFIIGQFGNPLFHIPGWRFVPTPTNRKVEQAFQDLDKVIYELIAQRREERKKMSEEEKKEVRTLLDMFIEAKDEENNTYLTDTEVRDNMMTFFMAGSETTATAMSWFLVNLADNPSVDARVREEIDTVLGNKQFTVQDYLDKFTFFNACIQETMRQTPPVFTALPRKTTKTEQVGNWTVPPGAQLVVNASSLAHHPKYWEDRYAFKPDRFMPENEDKIVPFSSIPFGAGRRSCLGRQFALQEMQIVLISLMQKYKMVREGPPSMVDGKPNVDLSEFPFMHPKKGLTVFRFSKI